MNRIPALTIAYLCWLISLCQGQIMLETGAPASNTSEDNPQSTAFSQQMHSGENPMHPGIPPTPGAAEALMATEIPLSKEGIPVFGAHLFQGAFRNISFTGFNPYYQISIGDTIQLMLWGSVSEQVNLIVDPQGNIFIPEVGPVQVAGVRNEKLDDVIKQRIQSVFRDTVQSYAVLATAQPVKVFVTGAVERPGLYGGFSSDSVLYFLDEAGGVDLDEGSFVDISIVRRNNNVEHINLYDFLVDGELSLVQLSDGDRIVVRPLRNTVTVEGAVRNAYRFEFLGSELPIQNVLRLAQPDPTATHVSVESENQGRRAAAYYSLEELRYNTVMIQPGDVLTLSRDLKPDSILVSVEGEHMGASFQVHPYGATLADAIRQIQPSALSDTDSLQLYRISVADRQKQRIEESLTNLERSILSARSDSLEEAKIRSEESKMLLQFIERARTAEPKGHVILGENPKASGVILEDGDVIFVPAVSNLVAVHGQVIYPTTQVWRDDMSVRDYVMMSGGFTDTADKDKILVVQTNGVVRDLDSTGKSYRSYDPLPGEEIIVLPEPDSKSLQFAKDISTILYQIAIAARVAVGI